MIGNLPDGLLSRTLYYLVLVRDETLSDYL